MSRVEGGCEGERESVIRSAPSNHQALLKGQDLRQFQLRSDWLAWRALLGNYALITVAFALPAWSLNPLTVLVSLILLGNRQLGLGILMHDCVHGALFRTNRLNQWVGQYLCAAPILAQFEGYRRYHLKHHAKAGTTDDPDYLNYRDYPVSPSSFRRKVLRDLSGVTGLRNFALLILMHGGKLPYDMAYKNTDAEAYGDTQFLLLTLCRNLAPAAVLHVVMIAALWGSGHLALYALWWLAYFTTFMLFSRIRNAAEHAAVPDLLDPDPRRHARTVYASWWERLTVAPNQVNYHLEHHWLPNVPPYRLKGFHQWLKGQGVLSDAELLPGYGAVIRRLTV